MQGLCSAEHAGKGLKGGTGDIDFWLLRREAAPGSLGMKAQFPRPLFLCLVTLLHMPRPDAACSPELGNLLKEIEMGIEEKGETRRKIVNIYPPLHGVIHIAESVKERESQFLGSSGSGLSDVIPADRNGVELRHLHHAEFDNVSNNPHMWSGWKDPLLLGDKLFQYIILQGTLKFLYGDALPFRSGDIEGK